MAGEPNARIALLRNQYLWVVSRKSGEFVVIVGPDPLDLTDDDRLIAPDTTKPGQIIFVEGEQANCRQYVAPFVTLGPNEYAVIHNPASNPTFPDFPNGSWRSKRQDVPSLAMGKKRVITRGSFPLWPGQWVEVRKIPTVQSHQFLLVAVEDPEAIDREAPYYQLLLECAGITTTLVDEVSSKQTTGTESSNDGEKGDKTPPSEPPAITTTTTKEEARFRRGQRIIVPGRLTESFIPPTGTDVIPVENAPKGEVLRQALVLGLTEFCRLFDENGQPRNTGGPGRVFPGPYDTVETLGSRKGVYDKYHLTSDSGLLLRIIAPRISKEDLLKQLPSNITLSEADDQKTEFTQGDEVFIAGVDAYFMPTMDLVVIDPLTREPHIGNDHSKVFVKAIAVDQKSAIYVEDKETGEVELKKGGQKYLLDPRRSRHVLRRVPGRVWNLLIAFGEPHKETEEEFVMTPWALSVVVPNNMAALIIGKGERRAVIGPKYDLLEFDELPEVLELSKGCPKSDKDTVETCFLRVDGNRVSDEIVVTSGDLVRFKIRVSYGVKFVGDGAEEQAKWFNHKNYVQLLADHLRSVLSAAAQLRQGLDIYRDVAGFVRDTVLGPKPTEGHRPGTLFEENKMLVNEVDVLTMVVEDSEVRTRLEVAHRKMASLSIEDVAAEAELASSKHRDAVDKQKLDLSIASLQREQSLALQRVQLENNTAVETAKLSEALQASKLEFEHKMGTLKQDAQAALGLAEEKYAAQLAEVTRGMDKANEQQRLALEAEQNTAALTLEKSRSEIKATLLAACAKTVVDQLAAVQPGLIAALEGMGDKQVLADLAKHLPAATGELGFLLGQGGIVGLRRLLEGTGLEGVLTQLGHSTELSNKANSATA